MEKSAKDNKEIYLRVDLKINFFKILAPAFESFCLFKNNYSEKTELGMV
jgi:hypothetical protein